MNRSSISRHSRSFAALTVAAVLFAGCSSSGDEQQSVADPAAVSSSDSISDGDGQDVGGDQAQQNSASSETEKAPSATGDDATSDTSVAAGGEVGNQDDSPDSSGDDTPARNTDDAPQQEPIGEPVDVSRSVNEVADPAVEVTVVAEEDSGGTLCLVPYDTAGRSLWNPLCTYAFPVDEPVTHDASTDNLIHPVIVYTPAAVTAPTVTVGGTTIDVTEIDVAALTENRAFVGFIPDSVYGTADIVTSFGD